MRRRERNKAKQIFLGGIIVFIMVTSVIGFMAGRGGMETEEYNGFTFIRKGNLWETRIDKKPVNFYYYPIEVEYIELDDAIVNKILSTPMLYLTYDQDQKGVEFIAQTQFELETTLAQHFNIYASKGFAKENEYNMPVVTCLNATTSVPVLDFRKTNQTKIYLEGNCIIIAAKSDFDFIKAGDRLVYGLFGIIK